jgi:hypothetical protein
LSAEAAAVRVGFEGSVRAAAAVVDDAGFCEEAAAADFCAAALAGGVEDFTARDACWSRDDGCWGVGPSVAELPG